MGKAKIEMRRPGKRTAPSEAKIRALESVAEGVASKAPGTDPRPAKGSKMRRVEGGERVTAYLPPDTVEALRVRCARERRSLSDAVTEAVRAWLDS